VASCEVLYDGVEFVAIVIDWRRQSAIWKYLLRILFNPLKAKLV
jgi:hypothetical protein